MMGKKWVEKFREEQRKREKEPHDPRIHPALQFKSEEEMIERGYTL